MVGSWIKLIDAHGSYMVDVQHPIDHQTLSAALPTHNCFTHGSLLIRRAALVEVGGYRVEFRLCEDYDLFLRMVERFSVANLPEILYLYRRSGYSTTSQLASQMGHFMEAARELARQRRARGKEVLMAGVTMR
jgi:GT2 family glycosyltransferase